MDVIDKMNMYIANSIAGFLGTAAQRGIEAEQKVVYTLRVLIDEVLKAIVLLAVFTILGKGMEYVIALLALGSIRMFLGGSHQNSSIKCIMYSFMSFLTILFLSGEGHNIGILLKDIIYILLSICILTNAPISKSKGINYTYSQRLNMRLKAMTMLLVISRLVEMVDVRYANIILCAVLFQTVDAGIAIMKSFLKKLNEKGEVK